MLYPKKRQGRLPHGVPAWVDPGSAIYHVRMRLENRSVRSLTDPELGPRLLESAVFYARRKRWWPHLFLLMPDHLHALLSFDQAASMTRVIGDWKRWHARKNAVVWQDGYFDHRIRREENLEHTIAYIRRNPVARGLCATIDDWPWRLSDLELLKTFDGSQSTEQGTADV
jgi:REP element-mobilizing transposase RayT